MLQLSGATFLLYTLTSIHFSEIIHAMEDVGNLCASKGGSSGVTCLDSEMKNVKLKLGDSRNGPDLIRANGFPLEKHYVTSPDGYVTTLYRIPGSRSGMEEGFPRKVALLHHGIIEDGFSWILNSVDKALAYRLADEAKVDVWLTNNRGTFYSLKHVNLSWGSNAYWDFSFHEIGIYDVPTIIDYILQVTGQRSLYYVGHSMGCAAFLVAMSHHPEYNEKIRTFIGLAPAVFVGNTSTPFEHLIPAILKQQEIYDSILVSGPFVSPLITPIMSFVGNICSNRIAASWICFALLETVFGYDFEEINYDMSGEIMRNGLSSASTKSLFHLLQLWISGRFQEYDYHGKNVEVYAGRSIPPDYPLSIVTCPIVLYCGEKDNLVSCQDVDELSKRLGDNVKEFKKIGWTQFNHIDFMFATNINTLLNDRIVEIVNSDEFYTEE